MKSLANRHSLSRHKKICPARVFQGRKRPSDFEPKTLLKNPKMQALARQRILCMNCSKIMPSLDYKSHRQNCTPRIKNESSSGLIEKIHKQLEVAGGGSIHDDSQLSDMTNNSGELSSKEQTLDEHNDGDNDSQLSDEMTIKSNEPDNGDDDSSDEMSVKLYDSDNSNQPEDEEDEQIDDKIWNAISYWCIQNREDALDGFRYWFQFCRMLDHDPTIKKILESVSVLRDENNSLTFKEALDLALMKRKYLVYETLKVKKAEGIWKTLLEEPDRGLDVFQWLKKYILVCKSMKRDPIFNSVNEMIEELMNDLDSMDFEEALNYSIEKKANEIFGAVGSLPRRDDAAHVWERISNNFKHKMVDSDWEVRYFINMYILIEHDETFQTVLTKIDEYLESGENLDLALYNAIRENQSLIHDSFTEKDELWIAMKEDEFGDEKEEMNIFETYILYYLALKRDKLFQSIIDELYSLEEDGWNHKDALNYVMQVNKADIRNKIGKPWIPGLNLV